MTNSSTIITASTLILILILAPSTHASGTIELLVTSPRTILLEPTVCANFECAAPDELSSPRKVQGELRFNTGRYQGESREAIDVHLKVIEPGTNAILAIEHHRPLADNEWNRVPIVVTTSSGFNVTVQLRNKCDRLQDLQNILQQPVSYVKEVLQEIAVYNTAPPHKSLWCLKPEYCNYKLNAQSEQ